MEINASFTMGITQTSKRKAKITKDLIKLIIKNKNDELLIFKDNAEKWDLYTIRRLQHCDIRNTICESINEIFPNLNIMVYHIIYESMKFENFNKHIYTFELKLRINDDEKTELNDIYNEYKWINNKKESKPESENNIKMKNKKEIESDIYNKRNQKNGRKKGE